MKRLLITPLMPLVLVLLFTACSPDVKAINKKPAKHVGKEVEITGIVKSYNVISPTEILYQVTDNSSEDDDDLIWVLRGEASKSRSVPNPNYRITLKGKIESERTIRNKKYAPVIIEVEAQEEIPKEAPAAF